jgi:hypothetical protein
MGSLWISLPRLSTTLLAVALAVIGTDTAAQDLEPRTYSNTPVGLNFFIASYAYTSGGVATDPTSPLENASVQAHGTILAYARALNVWGRSGKVDVVLPYAWVSGSAEFAGQRGEREISGFGDPRLRFSVNLYGAPALTLKEFVGYKQDFIVGASLQVSTPLGKYDDDRLLNIGTHRWTIKPELGISKTLGPLTLELAAGVSFYTDNHEFFGDQTRAQNPIYSVQGHAIYSLRSGIWVAVDGTYYTGGRTTVDGVEGNNLQHNSRVGLTVALPVNRYNSLKLYASTGVSTRTGSDFDTMGVAWQYRWGGGL